MRVEQSNLFSEMQSMQRELQVQSPQQDLLPQTQSISSPQQDFGMLLKDALNNVNGLQSNANDLRTRFDLGDRSVGIGEVMVAAQKSSIAFEATVQVRNKVVEAYKQIASMPV